MQQSISDRIHYDLNRIRIKSKT
jgi:hypothetical protein